MGTGELITRKQAAAKLGCSKAMVRHFEREGILHPTKGPHKFDIVMLSPEEVEALAAKWTLNKDQSRRRKAQAPERKVAAVLRLLQKGEDDVATIIIATGASPATIMKARELYGLNVNELADKLDDEQARAAEKKAQREAARREAREARVERERRNAHAAMVTAIRGGTKP